MGSSSLSATRGLVFVGRRRDEVFALTTTRLGGASQDPYRSLNLSRSVGDDPAAVSENIARVASALGTEPADIVGARQVHGVQIVPAVRGATAEADGLVTAADGPILAISVGDCLAVLAHDTRTGARGAAHAGWRGTVGGIGQRLLAAMRDHYGTDPSDCLVFLSPCIGPCCYRVPDTVDHPLKDDPRARPRLLVRTDDGWALDLLGENRAQLTEAGVQDHHLVADGRCTACHPELLFSHVRDQGVTGRAWALIGNAQRG